MGDIERIIRALKERFRCSTNSLALTYIQLPRIIIEDNIEDKIHWLNVFTPNYYIHPTTVPASMILGALKTDYKRLNLTLESIAMYMKKNKYAF